VDDRRAAEAMAVLETERGAKESERVARWWDARKASDESWKGKLMEAVVEAMFIVHQRLVKARSGVRICREADQFRHKFLHLIIYSHI